MIAEVPGRAAGPAVALRGDLDALPLDEQTGLPFASTRTGIMHACGHDAHTAMVVGAAELLLAGEPPSAPVRLLFQPAEETGLGARALLDAGALEGVGAVFGGHVDPRYPVGTLVVTPGPVNASTDAFRLRVLGRGGHAARPHECVDAVVVASHLVCALQTLVSREIDPGDPAVVTVGRLSAGSSGNVIAETALLEGTVRAFSPVVRQRLREGVGRLARGVCEAFGASAEVVFHGATPAVVNAPDMAALAREAAEAVVGAEAVTVLRTANLGGEDFSWYLDRAPGAFIRFGAGKPGAEAHPPHCSRFDLDERALAAGAAWMAAVARRMGERLAAR